MANHFFTSESVTEGHPDKICDQISDAVLDDILANDPDAHVACETCTTTGMVLVMGEITSSHSPDIPSIVRDTLEDIGYNNPKYGFDAKSCAVFSTIDKQSTDIAMGVNKSYESQNGFDKDSWDTIGAGDQGMMFGYACDETAELMPAPISMAHDLSYALSRARKDGILPWLRPDGKSQVTIEYDENNHVVRCSTIVVSTQHDPDVFTKDLHEAIIEKVIRPIIPSEYIDERTKFLINPTGRFVIGGPVGDSGLTGRKIIVDTYGGAAPHGGGAFSGKDPTKVDRSAAYAARWVAKNVVAAKLAHRCQVQLAYAIGVAEPVSILVETFGTGILPDVEIERAVRNIFDLRPAAIIHNLNLKRPIYTPLAAYGHMGREDLGVAWEKLDKVDELKSFLSL